MEGAFEFRTKLLIYSIVGVLLLLTFTIYFETRWEDRWQKLWTHSQFILYTLYYFLFCWVLIDSRKTFLNDYLLQTYFICTSLWNRIHSYRYRYCFLILFQLCAIALSLSISSIVNDIWTYLLNASSFLLLLYVIETNGTNSLLKHKSLIKLSDHSQSPPHRISFNKTIQHRNSNHSLVCSSPSHNLHVANYILPQKREESQQDNLVVRKIKQTNVLGKKNDIESDSLISCNQIQSLLSPNSSIPCISFNMLKMRESSGEQEHVQNRVDSIPVILSRISFRSDQNLIAKKEGVLFNASIPCSKEGSKKKEIFDTNSSFNCLHVKDSIFKPIQSCQEGQENVKKRNVERVQTLKESQVFYETPESECKVQILRVSPLTNRQHFQCDSLQINTTHTVQSQRHMMIQQNKDSMTKQNKDTMTKQNKDVTPPSFQNLKSAVGCDGKDQPVEGYENNRTEATGVSQSDFYKMTFNDIPKDTDLKLMQKKKKKTPLNRSNSHQVHSSNVRVKLYELENILKKPELNLQLLMQKQYCSHCQVHIQPTRRIKRSLSKSTFMQGGGDSLKLHTTKINLETSIKTSAVGYDSNNKEEADPSRQQFEDMLHHKRMVNETVDCGVLIVNQNIQIIHNNNQIFKFFHSTEVNDTLMSSLKLVKISEESLLHLSDVLHNSVKGNKVNNQSHVQNKEKEWVVENINIFMKSLAHKNLKKEHMSLRDFLRTMVEIFCETGLKEKIDHLKVEVISDNSSSSMYMAVQFKIYFGYREELEEYVFLMQFTNTRQRDIAIKKDISENISNRIFSTLSHEFGTYMNIISNITENALEDDAIPISLKKDYFRIIHTNSILLENVIKDMRDFFLIINQRLEIKREYVNLKETLFQTLELFKKQLQLKHLKVCIKIQKGIEQLVCSDGQLIKQILSNFISNSLKFTLSGEIKVYLYQHSQRYMRLEVRDSGIGMTNEECEKLTEMLKNGFSDEKISINSVGLGFGLLVSNNLARMIGNPAKKQAIHFQSQANEGSQFWFLINKNCALNKSSLNSPRLSTIHSFPKLALQNHLKKQGIKSTQLQTHSFQKLQKQKELADLKQEDFKIKLLKSNSLQLQENSLNKYTKKNNKIQCDSTSSEYYRSFSNPLVPPSFSNHLQIQNNQQQHSKTRYRSSDNAYHSAEYINGSHKKHHFSPFYVNDNQLNYSSLIGNDILQNSKCLRTMRFKELSNLSRTSNNEQTSELGIHKMLKSHKLELIQNQYPRYKIPHVDEARTCDVPFLNKESQKHSLSQESTLLISSRIIMIKNKVRHTIMNKSSSQQNQQQQLQSGQSNQCVNPSDNVSDNSIEGINKIQSHHSIIPSSQFDSPYETPINGLNYKVQQSFQNLSGSQLIVPTSNKIHFSQNQPVHHKLNTSQHQKTPNKTLNEKTCNNNHRILNFGQNSYSPKDNKKKDPFDNNQRQPFLEKSLNQFNPGKSRSLPKSHTQVESGNQNNMSVNRNRGNSTVNSDGQLIPSSTQILGQKKESRCYEERIVEELIEEDTKINNSSNCFNFNSSDKTSENMSIPSIHPVLKQHLSLNMVSQISNSGSGGSVAKQLNSCQVKSAVSHPYQLGLSNSSYRHKKTTTQESSQSISQNSLLTDKVIDCCTIDFSDYEFDENLSLDDLDTQSKRFKNNDNLSQYQKNQRGLKKNQNNSEIAHSNISKFDLFFQGMQTIETKTINELKKHNTLEQSQIKVFEEGGVKFENNNDIISSYGKVNEEKNQDKTIKQKNEVDFIANLNKNDKSDEIHVQKSAKPSFLFDQNIFSFGGDEIAQINCDTIICNHKNNLGKIQQSQLLNNSLITNESPCCVHDKNKSKTVQQSNVQWHTHNDNLSQSPRCKMLTVQNTGYVNGYYQKLLSRQQFRANSQSLVGTQSNLTLSMTNIEEKEDSIQLINDLHFNAMFQNEKQQKKIMIVDDEIFNIYSLKLIFQKFGLKDNILEAYNGVQAIEQIINEQKIKSKRNNELGNQIGMIIMDVNMPIMNGIDCTKYIRNLEANQTILYSPRIIGYTAFSDLETRTKCIEAGMDHILLKPSRRDDFISVIETYYLNS